MDQAADQDDMDQDDINPDNLAVSAEIACMAQVLLSMADAMCGQAHFHLDEQVEFGMSTLRESWQMASQRASSARTAGPNFLHAMRKSVVRELAGAVFLSSTVVEAAGPEAWPDLCELLDRGRRLVAASLLLAPDLLGQANISAVQLAQASPAGPELEYLTGWHVLEDACYAASRPRVGGGHTILSAAPIKTGRNDRAWIARVDGLGVGISSTPHAAALVSLRAWHVLMADQDTPLPVQDSAVFFEPSLDPVQPQQSHPA